MMARRPPRAGHRDVRRHPRQDGIDPEITDLAIQIGGPGPEIARLNIWLDEWGAPQPDDMGDESSDGMMSEEDMQALDGAEGTEAGRLFLEQMIVHHQAAVEMAQTEVENGSNKAPIEMASTIVTSQSSEIQTIKGLLAGM